MPDQNRHESADLEDYQVEDSADTLDGPPGDDPLDRGVVPPERWSSSMRIGSTASEQASGESLDELLAEEEPDITAEIDDECPEDIAEDEDAQDVGIDGGAATAEEAAVHVVRDDDNDVRSGD